MVRKKKEIKKIRKKEEEGCKKEWNQDGGCNRRQTAGGLFTVTEGGGEREMEG